MSAKLLYASNHHCLRQHPLAWQTSANELLPAAFVFVLDALLPSVSRSPWPQQLGGLMENALATASGSASSLWWQLTHHRQVLDMMIRRHQPFTRPKRPARRTKPSLPGWHLPWDPLYKLGGLLGQEGPGRAEERQPLQAGLLGEWEPCQSGSESRALILRGKP